jgi:hypothetical protein
MEETTPACLGDKRKDGMACTSDKASYVAHGLDLLYLSA